MIDFFDITVSAKAMPDIGKQLTVTHAGGYTTESLTEHVVRPGRGAPQFKVKLSKTKEELRLWGSPAMFLQCHNGIGGNDFRPLVECTVDMVFECLKRDLPATVRSAIREGDYRVHEVHIAEHYRVAHAQIGSLCDTIRRYSPASLGATALTRGIGVRLWPESRDRSVLIYDKVAYYHDGLIDHKRKLLGKMPPGFERIGVNMNFQRMMDDVLTQGVRIETRLQRTLQSRSHFLGLGRHWTAESSRAAHRRVLHEVPLNDLPIAADRKRSIDAIADHNERRLLALWMSGWSMRDFFGSDASYYRYRKAYLAKHAIDLSFMPTQIAGVRWADLINVSNIIETPEWAKEDLFAFDPAAAKASADSHQLQRAWLMFSSQRERRPR